MAASGRSIRRPSPMPRCGADCAGSPARPGTVTLRCRRWPRRWRRTTGPDFSWSSPGCGAAAPRALLLSILRALAPHWRIVIATTERDPHLMSVHSGRVTREIFHLEAMLDAGSRRAFLSHLVASRRCG